MFNVYKDLAKTFDFGMRKSGEVIPEHLAFYTEYTEKEFENKFKFFISQVNKGQDSTSGFRQIKGIVETILNDYKADIKNPKLPKDKVINHYKKYKAIAERLVSPKNAPGPIRAWVEDQFYIIK